MDVLNHIDQLLVESEGVGILIGSCAFNLGQTENLKDIDLLLVEGTLPDSMRGLRIDTFSKWERGSHSAWINNGHVVLDFDISMRQMESMPRGLWRPNEKALVEILDASVYLRRRIDYAVSAPETQQSMLIRNSAEVLVQVSAVSQEARKSFISAFTDS